MSANTGRNYRPRKSDGLRGGQRRQRQILRALCDPKDENALGVVGLHRKHAPLDAVGTGAIGFEGHLEHVRAHNSSATNGSSIVSVGGKKRCPAMPCAKARPGMASHSKQFQPFPVAPQRTRRVGGARVEAHGPSWRCLGTSPERRGEAATLLHSAQPVRRAPHARDPSSPYVILRTAHAYNLLLPPLTLSRTDRTIA